MSTVRDKWQQKLDAQIEQFNAIEGKLSVIDRFKEMLASMIKLDNQKGTNYATLARERLSGESKIETPQITHNLPLKITYHSITNRAPTA